MAMDFGLSFNPGQQTGNAQDPQKAGSQTPIQDAIRTLSLRLPTFRGPGIAPMPLLTAQGSAGVMGQGQMPGGLQQLLQQMFGQMQPGGMAPQGGMAQQGPPAPKIIPGDVPMTPPAPRQPSGPITGGGAGYDAPMDPGHFFPGNWPQ